MADRTVLKISGAETRDFLQGLVTNDVAKLDRGLVYAAMLTPQGKYRADFFLVPAGEAILLDVATSLAAGLKQALTMYKLRSKVEIEETDIAVTRGLGDAPDGAFADPRDPSLGWRGYDGQPGDDGVDWDALRVSAIVPESDVELTGDSFILEMGFERLNGVDFRKGCYVGQEVTARMKHKTELRKGLAQVAVEGRAPVGSEIVAGEKAAGTLFTQAAGQGLAYLRFDRAGDDMRAEDAVVRYSPA
ncbi:folate-binding protein [Marivita sp.]|uniref:CAF17-like 4Fe-4S cluster assembly/insertion protein YgfZ n=1 Tax=Marivita sp. TaxID=2003365 RepID=UPI0025C51B97|nr:folate-binding protein [Marivita sp.]